QLVVAVASGGAFAWWVATVGMRLLVRWLESLPMFRAGPLAPSAAVLFVFAALLSAVLTLVAWELFDLLIGAPALVGLDRTWAGGAWRDLTFVATVLLALAGSWAALREALAA